MRLQKSPERGLCIVAAFAMVFDEPADQLLTELGDKWKTLAFEGLPVPYCWRGVHTQELILLALKRRLAVTPIELFPQVAPPQFTQPSSNRSYNEVVVFHGETEDANWAIFNNVILNQRGVVKGLLAPRHIPFRRGHAVAFENGVIFDPDGEAYQYSVAACEQHNFYPHCAYRIDQMESPYVQSIQPDSEVGHAYINN